MSWIALHASRAVRGWVPPGRPVHPSMRLWWEKAVFIEGEVVETISPYRLQHLPSLFENLPTRILEPLKELAWALPVLLPLAYVQTISLHNLRKKYEVEGDPRLLSDE